MGFDILKSRVIDILETQNIKHNEKLKLVCELLRNEVNHYDWVGFYFKNNDKEELVLEAFVGEPTEHTVIPFGKGICGQVAVSNKNFSVDDVGAQDNYIACSINVKSEIVIPLFVNAENIGQIDIDSHTIKAFNQADEDFLVWVNSEISKILS
ncbi:MAG: GAF domain-containing protein [Psychroflexus sp.]|nr:GAF domain-containing protein [Psychroflexus sp.]MDN6311200.1 GAF domain-containing protein [Psychroflexus sp.]